MILLKHELLDDEFMFIRIRPPLLTAKKAPLADFEIAQTRNGLVLVFQNFLDQILDRNHAHTILLRIYNEQMTNVLEHHLLHARLETVFRASHDNLGSKRANVLDEGTSGCSRYVIDVITLGTHANDAVMVIGDG